MLTKTGGKQIITRGKTSYNKEIRYHTGLGPQAGLITAVFRIILWVTFAGFVIKPS